MADPSRGHPDPEPSLRLFIESVKDYAIFMLDRQGRVATWNIGAQRLKGYTAAEIIGTHFSRFYPPSDIAAGKPDRELEVAAAEGRLEDEGWRIKKDGTRFWANVVITAIRDATGTLVGFGKVTRDMTDRRAREEENARLAARVQAHAHELEAVVQQRTAALQEANDALLQANAALETFAHSVAHDLRGPLRTIQGFADILLQDHAAAMDAEGIDYLTRIRASAHRLSDLVSNLLAYSRVARAGAVCTGERVSWDRVVEAAKRDLEPEIARTQAGVSIQSPLGEVVGHREALTLIAHNLLANALKFVPPGVRPQIHVWSERRDTWVRLHVRDNGIGVAPAEQGRIFNPFERLHASVVYSGTGLGLAIVAQAMTRLGGRYGVSSDGRTGSCFWVELPAPPDRLE